MELMHLAVRGVAIGAIAVLAPIVFTPDTRIVAANDACASSGTSFQCCFDPNSWCHLVPYEDWSHPQEFNRYWWDHPSQCPNT